MSVLKIDRAFIRELHANPADQRLTGTVIDMARHFEFITVAEGVEQEAQLERLMDMGCDLVQGFMFAPPLKEDALFRLMQHRLRASAGVRRRGGLEGWRSPDRPFAPRRRSYRTATRPGPLGAAAAANLAVRKMTRKRHSIAASACRAPT